MAAAEEKPGKLLFFPGVIAEDVLRERERQADETADGVKIVLGDLDALAEISCGLSAGDWQQGRAYTAAAIMERVTALRELLGVA